MRLLTIVMWTLGLGVSTCILLLFLWISKPFIANYLNREAFHSEKWKNWKESENEMSLRWNMVSDLEDNYKLKGMKTDEVLRLLGEPDTKGKTEWTYNLGMSGHGIDTGTLILTIEDNRVKSFRIYTG